MLTHQEMEKFAKINPFKVIQLYILWLNIIVLVDPALSLSI